MPPPRRRRPVQPTTRVRLPRAARLRGAPGAEPGTEPGTAGWPDGGNGHAPEQTAAALGEPAAAELAEAAELGEPTVARPETAEVARPETAVAGTGTTDGKLDEDTAGDEAAVRAVPAAPHEREPLLLPACFGALAVVLGGLAVWFGLKAGSTSTGVSAFGTNIAVSDAAATAEVNRQIDSAVNTIFSYNYADTAKTAQAAKNLLTGKASQQYATLFKVVQAEAPQEKLVLTTTVTNSGVETLTGNNARLLIFANQQDTAASSHSTTDAGAMFAVTAVRQGGRWKIEDIDTFSAGG